MRSWAYVIAHDGAAIRLPVAEGEMRAADAKLLWLHIDGNDADCMDWLERRSGLPHPVVEALRAIETRPRATPLEKGALVNLRGVNENPDADPDDLVSIRLWAEAGRIISVNYRPLLALGDMCNAVAEGRIRDPGDLIAILAELMTARLDPVTAGIGEVLDAIEEDVVDERLTDLRQRIGRVRLTAIGLRRYISPQREALYRLATDRFDFLEPDDRVALSEAANRVTRMIEELDTARERATILSEQLSDLRAEATAERTLVLSVVSSIFLPLTVLTGLLGMNVDGIPFHDRPWAFAGVCAACVAIGAGLLLWFRRKAWF